MSEKRNKQIRRIARFRYNAELYRWQMNKPSKWRIFKYLKWKKSKPVYEHVEKQIKNIANVRK